MSRSAAAVPMVPACAVSVTLFATTSAAASPSASTIDATAVSSTLFALEVIVPTRRSPARSVSRINPSTVASTWPLPVMSVVANTLTTSVFAVSRWMLMLPPATSAFRL